MYHRWVDISSFLSVWRPCAPVVRFFMQHGSCEWGYNWGVVLVKGFVKLCIL